MHSFAPSMLIDQNTIQCEKQYLSHEQHMQSRIGLQRTQTWLKGTFERLVRSRSRKEKAAVEKELAREQEETGRLLEEAQRGEQLAKQY